jgi:cell fate regulator YaaT (PSP1 superfamily)
VLGATGSPEGGDAGEQREIFRRASDEDVNTYRANLQREERLFEQCRELAAEHAPDMKPVACHLLIGEPKLVLFFTAEGRIDFRALLKAMNANLRMRVELRQIGARDVSRMFGGMGPCGGSFCCSTFLRKPPSVSIRMAKTQNLSLSSTKASGPCGRLLCCLSYEHEFYQEARRAIPAEGTELTVDGRDVRVVEVNPVSGVLWVRDSEGGYFTVRTCRFRYDQERKEWQVTDCPSDS